MRLFRFSWERGFSSSSGGDAGGFAVIAVLTSEMTAPQPGQVALVALMPSGILSFFPQDLQIVTVGMVTPPPFNLMRECSSTLPSGPLPWEVSSGEIVRKIVYRDPLAGSGNRLSLSRRSRI